MVSITTYFEIMMNTEVQNLKQFGTKNVGSGLSRLTDAIFEKGQGSWLHTSEGKWLDFSSGIGNLISFLHLYII